MGNVYPTQCAMLKAYKVQQGTYYKRVKAGHDLETCLLGLKGGR